MRCCFDSMYASVKNPEMHLGENWVQACKNAYAIEMESEGVHAIKELHSQFSFLDGLYHFQSVCTVAFQFGT